TFSRLTARKCCCHPRRGKRQKACALPLFASPFLFTNKFSPKWAWLGGHPGVWMQFHVRSILASGTAPGRMACSTPREHGKKPILARCKRTPPEIGGPGGYPPWRGPGAGPGWRDWEGRLASLPWLSGNSFSTERVPLGVWGTECPHMNGRRPAG